MDKAKSADSALIYETSSITNYVDPAMFFRLSKRILSFWTDVALPI